MANMGKLMKQAQQMQAKMASLQKELEAREFEGSAGGGMVTCKVNGKQELLDISINPECVDPSDVEVLQDMVKAAVNQAMTDSSETVSNAMSKITGGMNLPGMF